MGFYGVVGAEFSFFLIFLPMSPGLASQALIPIKSIMKRGLLLPLLLLVVFPLWAQGQADMAADPLSFVGMSPAELIGRLGPPGMVLAVRGNELWQDDVVFQYAEGDFYIYRDRVWQVKLASLRGISNGDPKAVALLVLGDAARDRGDHVLLPVTGGSWPLMLRVNFNETGLVSAIYIYRPDF